MGSHAIKSGDLDMAEHLYQQLTGAEGRELGREYDCMRFLTLNPKMRVLETAPFFSKKQKQGSR